MRVVLVSPVALANSAERMVKRAAPRHTQTLVRMPAGRLRMLRSTPMAAPRTAAQSSRDMTVVRGSMAMTEVYIGKMPSKKGLLGLVFEETSRMEQEESEKPPPF